MLLITHSSGGGVDGLISSEKQDQCLEKSVKKLMGVEMEQNTDAYNLICIRLLYCWTNL